MKLKDLLQMLSLFFLSVSLIAGVYVLFLDQETTPLTFKIFFAYILVALAFLSWLIFKVYKQVFLLSSDIANTCADLEKLLLDLRDGTKTFYREKRKFVRAKDGILAKIAGQVSDELIKVLDISYEGALLRTTQQLKSQDTIDLNIYLPIFPQPIEVKAKVIRVIPAKIESQPPSFDVGVKFLNISPPDKEKLIETVDLFIKRLRE